MLFQFQNIDELSIGGYRNRLIQLSESALQHCRNVPTQSLPRVFRRATDPSVNQLIRQGIAREVGIIACTHLFQDARAVSANCLDAEM